MSYANPAKWLLHENPFKTIVNFSDNCIFFSLSEEHIKGWNSQAMVPHFDTKKC